jgi:hypothetical protein
MEAVTVDHDKVVPPGHEGSFRDLSRPRHPAGTYVQKGGIAAEEIPT